MRILVHDYAGHPFQVQLSRQLATRGHDVRHAYCGAINTPRGSLARNENDPSSFSIGAIELKSLISKYSFFQRFRRESEYARKLCDLIDSFRPEAVLSANTPSIPLAAAARHCEKRGVRFVPWVQDLYGLAAYRVLSKKLPVIGQLVGRYFIHLDRRAFQRAEGVVVISGDFTDVLRQWGIDEQLVEVIHNWAPLNELPLCERENAWASEHGLSSERVRFLYSGTLSIRHNPELLLRLAQRFDERGDAELVVVSQGEGADWLREHAAREGVRSLLQLPFQPFNLMPQVFGSADVLVSILEPDAGVFCVPSKVLSYMCAGRAQLAAMPLENLSSRLIRENGIGSVVAPHDVDGFMAAATKVIADENSRAEAGSKARKFAEKNFEIQSICHRFESLLSGGVVSADVGEHKSDPTSRSRRIAA